MNTNKNKLSLTGNSLYDREERGDLEKKLKSNAKISFNQ